MNRLNLWWLVLKQRQRSDSRNTKRWKGKWRKYCLKRKGRWNDDSTLHIFGHSALGYPWDTCLWQNIWTLPKQIPEHCFRNGWRRPEIRFFGSLLRADWILYYLHTIRISMPMENENEDDETTFRVDIVAITTLSGFSNYSYWCSGTSSGSIKVE